MMKQMSQIRKDEFISPEAFYVETGNALDHQTKGGPCLIHEYHATRHRFSAWVRQHHLGNTVATGHSLDMPQLGLCHSLIHSIAFLGT